MNLRDNIFAVYQNLHLTRGTRRDMQHARFSVMLILSPRNIASIRSRNPLSSSKLQKQLQRFVGNAIVSE